MENRKLDSIIRLSNLPDSVLSHILSFFPTKLSIRTSILARRWRYLWSYVPALYFDSEYDDEEFIERVSSLHKPKTINTFRLYLKDVHNGIEPQIKAWIASAIKRNVQSVDLFFTCFDNLLHQSLFTSKTLVDLKISSSSFIPVVVTPLAVCLPRLKKIHLSPVLYAGGTSLSDLLSSCPALEEVVIRLIIKCSSRPFTISSPTIKRLTVRFQLTRTTDKFNNFLSQIVGFRSCNHAIEINTPALRYLNVVDYLSVRIESGAMNSLIGADIYLNHVNRKQEDFPSSRSVLEFIDRLCNVKCLRLDLSYCKEILDSVFSAWFISFNNLNKLELTADCRFLSKFIESADNLEILVFWEVSEDIKSWIEPPQVPKCLSSHLRTIRLVEIVGTKHEFEIVRYLLKNAKVLERMEIVYPPFLESHEKIYVLEQIDLLERRSEACELEFVEIF
ncbi:hypothetical protein ABFS82_13G077000 [Erythranthe guttata]|uniref:FBD-associated F-box protein At4g10400-like n=1 Tax=Erythranthe guttata TaxID=4155 RepID=UPI00064DF873|nr:PREDICTED: FBD-associated F-box protein At4g10400-like [Erythranthe guttata]|eukprot:XP_012848326.1 PREDICTED: FBD-associated F-box protein At4g10400-like [Erythranthe guttata]